MCFGDSDGYTTKTYIRNGHQYTVEETIPRHGMSWRRRLGLGGRYYPTSYYVRPPRGRFINPEAMYLSHYPHHGYTYGGMQMGPRRQMMPGGYPRGVMPGGFSVGAGYGGYAQYYHPHSRALMPGHSSMVSLLSFSASPIPAHVPSQVTPLRPQSLACDSIKLLDLRLYRRDTVIVSAWLRTGLAFTSYRLGGSRQAVNLQLQPPSPNIAHQLFDTH